MTAADRGVQAQVKCLFPKGKGRTAWATHFNTVPCSIKYIFLYTIFLATIYYLLPFLPFTEHASFIAQPRC